jgi:gas vesicle protein
MDNHDIFDGIRKNKLKKLKASGDTLPKVKKEKKTATLVLPVVGYNPFTGVILGAAGISSFKLGNPETTRLSSFVPSYTWTTNNQNVFRANSSLFTKNDNYYIFNSLLWSISPQTTYGVGANTSEDWETEINPSTIKFVLRGYKKVIKNLYVGLNIHYDNKYGLEDNTADEIQDIITNGKSTNKSAQTVQNEIDEKYGKEKLNPFWQENIDQTGFANDYLNGTNVANLQQKYYTTPFGIEPNGTKEGESVYSGFGLNVLYDSRDNINTPYKGTYANFILNTFKDWTGSSYNSSLLYMDLRHYVKLTDNYTQILGFWGLANLTFGDVPYLNLPRIGGDDWFASGRGYTAGRYLGEKLLYLETEYRVNVYKWFGVNLFANAHTVSEKSGDFDYINPGYGVGLTFRAIKQSRSTINLDYGAGKDGSSGLYMRFISAF